ncbi:hypothetical protein AKJ37_07930 [candidate division MSBL1 archaeon SCGC-AAA259I09]|uniref:PIN domain-containing protein n=1 Tax=candidate division MSBL1 archaeon SCGC-AAA259I09 TaxID=1698267 RepID=A0A133UJ95_9EURY|nr:hypothetical protein AKJ37_07930 [candidate division MSBL1 archaeon SCGC-AAA259I09]
MHEGAGANGKRLYLDADVWLNLLQGEMLGFVPAFQRAKRLFAKIREEKWELVVSDLVEEEVCNQGPRVEDMRNKVSGLEEQNLVERASIKKTDRKKAGEIHKNKSLHFSDALHAAIALRKSSILVTRNMRHFSAVEDLLEVLEPETLLRSAGSLPPHKNKRREKRRS